MPRWIPVATWKGRDVFIIGGGDSLRKFNWNLLKNECTVGCNSAYTLGVKTCKVCIFGDAKWFKYNEVQLRKYEGILFTNSSQHQRTKVSWLWTMRRKTRGLHVDALGWNFNTGAAAINLALILGAKRVFLLGFDMHLSRDGKNNWHEESRTKPDAGVFGKFVEGFTRLSTDLDKVFPGREVINITDDSDLNVFPKISCKQFWNERKK